MGCPVESSWQVVQSVMPLIDWCARESGPGEICAAAVIEEHKILNTTHPRIPGLERVRTLFARRVYETVTFASTEWLISDLCNSSALFDEIFGSLMCWNQALKGRCRPLSKPSITAITRIVSL